jgi:Domain of unknown function (DUF4337)
MSEAAKPLSRSEREAKIKDKAGWIIALIAGLLAINTLYGNSNSGAILNSTMTINDTYSFYQAKSIKQSIAEGQMDEAITAKDDKRAAALKAKIDRYESDPTTGEGKKELMAKAKQLESDREAAKKRGPYYTLAGSALQISVVLMSAAILSVSMPLFWAGVGVGAIGTALMSQALWMLI